METSTPMQPEPENKFAELQFAPRIAEAIAKLKPSFVKSVKKSLAILAEKNMKLVIHFDLNNTLLVMDSTSGHANLAGTISETLSKAALGTVFHTPSGKIWCGYVKDPLTPRGSPDEMSWYEFQRSQIPIDAVLKEKAATFIETDGKYLRDEYDVLLRQGEEVFVSFYVTLHLFRSAKYVFRSFGKDIPTFVSKLGKDGVTSSVAIYHSRQGCIEVRHEETSLLNPKSFTKDLLVGGSEQFLAIQEDYDWWKKNGKKAKHGKIIHGDDDLLQIGFDDLNCMITKDRNAVAVQISTVGAAMVPTYFAEKIVRLIMIRLRPRRKTLIGE